MQQQVWGLHAIKFLEKVESFPSPSIGVKFLHVSFSSPGSPRETRPIRLIVQRNGLIDPDCSYVLIRLRSITTKTYVQQICYCIWRQSIVLTHDSTNEYWHCTDRLTRYGYSENFSNGGFRFSMLVCLWNETYYYSIAQTYIAARRRPQHSQLPAQDTITYTHINNNTTNKDNKQKRERKRRMSQVGFSEER